PASTAARADAFLLPDSLQFAEYNAESPAGLGYSQRLSELFDGEPLMARFRECYDVRHYSPIPMLLEALMNTYRDWGGTARPPLQDRAQESVLRNFDRRALPPSFRSRRSRDDSAARAMDTRGRRRSGRAHSPQPASIRAQA